MKDFFNSIGDTVSTAVFSVKEHSTDIEFWGGLGLIFAGMGIAIYKSVKRVPEIKREYAIQKKDLEIKEVVSEIPEKDIKKLKGKIIRETTWNYVKAYGPEVLMVGVGTFLTIEGFLGEKASAKEGWATASATAAAFSSYRKRNAELIGEDQEKALYYGADVKKVKEKVTDEDGNVKTVAKYQLIQKEDVPLDPYTYEWSPETTDACRENDDLYEYNMAFLVGANKDWQHIFSDFDTKVIWLVDILRAIGLEDEARLCSRHVGWLNKKYFNTPGDGYIDFRITPMRYLASDGVERWKFMLNFNCDGDVYELAKDQVGLMATLGNELP